jgi:hypothetical protein
VTDGSVKEERIKDARKLYSGNRKDHSKVKCAYLIVVMCCD